MVYRIRKGEGYMSNTPSRGLFNRMNKKKREEREQKNNTKTKSKDGIERIRDYPLFRAVKPKTKFHFFSDYFTVDDKYGTVLTVLHHKGSDDNLPYFWGINLIPRGLGNDITVRKFEHVHRVSDSWISQHQTRAEGLLANQMNEMSNQGSLTSKHRISKEQQQLVEIAQDLVSGSSYLRVAFRLLIKAPTLEKLDEAVEKINRQYKDRFDTLYGQAYAGEQRRELSTLLGHIDSKLGRNFMFTSAEFAGNYSLVTRGIEDPTGEYIGQMVGDVNNSAVLMDLDDYDSHVVIAGNAPAQTLSGWDFKGERGVDVWGAKLGMSALLRNKRVVHLVLNRSKVDKIGIDLSDITSKVDMTQGDINPFEMFGKREDELNIFPAHLEKITLMVEQLQPMGSPEKRARITGALKKVLNDFYVDKRMWARNAQENRHSLRIVGIPHEQVPRLPEFQAYLDMEYNAQVQSSNKDPEVMNAFGFLSDAFRDMMDSNGDLFNTTTSDVIDRASVSSRVIYDFSSLIQRGRGLMMAQFINALGFSVGNLRQGDVVILHGAEFLTEGVVQYVRDVFDQLGDNGVRTVFIYGSVERMLQDRAFNRFERADYTLLGGMTRAVINEYETILRQEVPVALKSLLEHREPYRYYLRRGFDNIVFASDIQMGFRKR